MYYILESKFEKLIKFWRETRFEELDNKIKIEEILCFGLEAFFAITFNLFRSFAQSIRLNLKTYLDSKCKTLITLLEETFIEELTYKINIEQILRFCLLGLWLLIS